jgi:uncharacterized protein
MNPRSPQPALSEAELERLESLLAAESFRGEAMPLDALQGFFFALASGPEDIAPVHWLPVALGEIAERGDTDTEIGEAIDLVMRFRERCARDVETDRFGLLLYARDDGTRDFQTWCAGYLDGVELAVPAWDEVGDAMDVDELLFPFIVLAGELPEDEKSRFSAAEWSDLVRSCEGGIADAIVQVREYWEALRHRPTTVRRDASKVGRNDPCPCGSGKKFKHCCAKREAMP